ncbi:hypothetical protein AAFF_G00127230 [Aldrovandia affinis]|uniref:Uncharacterized protein n=1 Tax=Aldrovandia affinis TaxID=143900 RepID=A0AAD7T248_9TELE|nr:hypothetical protein AAFF_G00127230 [Aldrovandia affinis]
MSEQLRANSCPYPTPLPSESGPRFTDPLNHFQHMSPAPPQNIWKSPVAEVSDPNERSGVVGGAEEQRERGRPLGSSWRLLSALLLFCSRCEGLLNGLRPSQQTANGEDFLECHGKMIARNSDFSAQSKQSGPGNVASWL